MLDWSALFNFEPIMRVIIVFLILCARTFSAQTIYKVKGNVVDSLENPLEGVIVNLLSAPTNVLMKTELTLVDGTYEFEVKDRDTLKLMMLMPGYLSHFSRNIFIGVRDSVFVMPKVVLKSSLNSLKEVEVSVAQSYIERRPDRTIINPEAQISSAGGSALDALSKAPGVMVGQNGAIKLKGKAGVVVYIDDKPSYLSGADLESFLRSISVSNIKQIELIPNPPANYEAAGNGGIINIRTKKNKLKGINGSTTVNYGQGRYARSNNSFNLNFSNDKFSIFSGANAVVLNHFQDLTIKRIYKNEDLSTKSVFSQRTYIKIGTQSYSARLGVDYYLNPTTTIGFNTRASFSPSAVKKYNLANVIDSNGNLVSNVIADNSDENALANGMFNLNLRKQIGQKGSSINCDADYVRYRANMQQTFKNNILEPSGYSVYSDLQNGDLLSNISIYAFKADYTAPINKNSKIDVGVKTGYTQTNNDARYSITLNQIEEPNYTLSNNFFYDELINGAYLNYSTSLKKLEVQVGLRFESTNLKGSQLGNPMRQVSTFKRNYENLFPTAFLSYRIDSVGNNVLSLNYGKRIDRPFFKDLNPFVSPLDRFTFYEGNPYLKPSIAHNINLAYSYKNLFSTTISYNNVIDQTRETIEIREGIYYSRPSNIGSTVQYNISFDGTIPLSKWLNTTYYSEISYSEYKSRLYTETLNAKGTYIYFNLNNSFILGKNWSFELSGEYITNVTETQFIVGDFGHMTIGAQAKILKGKGSLKLSISDLLYTNRTRGIINNLRLTDANWNSLRDTRVASVTFSYRFGKNTSKKPRYSSTSAESEVKRIK